MYYLGNNDKKKKVCTYQYRAHFFLKYICLCWLKHRWLSWSAYTIITNKKGGRCAGYEHRLCLVGDFLAAWPWARYSTSLWLTCLTGLLGEFKELIKEGAGKGDLFCLCFCSSTGLRASWPGHVACEVPSTEAYRAIWWKYNLGFSSTPAMT